jgi:hypothetical protein
MVITSRLLSGLSGFSSSSFGPFTSSSRGERWLGEQQEESTTVLPDIPSFCNNRADGVSSVSDVFGTHIENIGSRGGEHPRAYGHRVTHTLTVLVRNLRGESIS